ncbi:MAG: polyphosphate--glucose phosphotransferase [Tepidiformaceae bacterium]
MTTALGIDIGGTGIKAAVVDLEHGTLATQRKRLKTPHPATPKAVAQTIQKLVDDDELRAPQLVGAGFPAAIKDGHVLSAANVDRKWIGPDAAALISTATGRRTVVLNDADAAGLAAIRFGAGKGVDGVVLMITLGTGIGCGLFFNGALFPNTELGHVQVRGKDAELRASESVREKKDLSWRAWARRVQEYLDVIDRLLWPDLVIIGGGVSATPEKFLPRIHIRPKLVAATLGNEAGIIGAAMYAAETAAPVAPTM